jgi:putative addiction module killer protein
MELDVGFLELENGKCPYLDWEQKLDKQVRGEVRVRINRLRLGNFGDCKTIKGTTGLYELRIHLGAGHRLYFGKAHDKLVIVLCGGSKRSQERDIEKAKEYWRLYKSSIRKR